MSTAVPSPTPPAPRRFSVRLPRPLSIGLATVVLIVVAVGLQVGTPIYRQHVAIREIEDLGEGAGVTTRPNGPDWLRRLVGDEWMEPFDTADTAMVVHKQATDASLCHLHWLPDLRVLHIEDVPVTNGIFLEIKQLHNLKAIILCRTQISDDGLAQLAGLSQLEELLLSNPQLSDAGLVHLQRLTNLRNLQLQETRVTDAGLSNLSKLTGLTSLYLENTAITDAGLIHIQPMKNLSHLFLDNSRVSDAGLKNLHSLAKLGQITLGGTAVTETGVADLQAAIPDLKIIW